MTFELRRGIGSLGEVRGMLSGGRPWRGLVPRRVEKEKASMIGLLKCVR